MGDVLEGADGSGEYEGEESADFVAGQWNQLLPAVVAAWPVNGRAGGCHDGQEGVGEQGEGGPAVPGGPASDLVLVQGGEFLAGLEAFLDAPASAGDGDQSRQWDRLGCPGAVERQFAGAAVAPDQQVVVAWAGLWVGQGDQCPVVPAVAFGAGGGFSAVMGFLPWADVVPLDAFYDKSRRIRSAFNCSPLSCR